MNISEAKNYIKDTVTMYLKKDEYGDYRIPVVRQRPVFLIGAPGIGKSAIMEQIAGELDIALVAYSMTHHTRQSALGLPFIKTKTYAGVEYDISEYTMSEIIASIYETMEESGHKEGILFLDEINCVSETLYPSMLQFLQFKTFGRHAVPQGWVIATAGNPPEYNRSVRQFDVVTLDRLKVLNVEADYTAWKQYADERGIHGAILGFLDANRDSFYKIEMTSDGRSYVTARGWEDLSDILHLYEESQVRVTQELIGQYLRCDSVVRNFAAYYDLYNKYKDTYNAEALLDNGASDIQTKSAKNAAIDERLALVGLLLDRIKTQAKESMAKADMLKAVQPSLRFVKSSDDVIEALKKQIEAQETLLDKKGKAGTLSADEKRSIKMKIELFSVMSTKAEKVQTELSDIMSTKTEKRQTEGKEQDCAACIDECYNERVQDMKDYVNRIQRRLTNLFDFIVKAFGEESNEMIITVTELTLNGFCASFIGTFGCNEYERYAGRLQISKKQDELLKEITNLYEN